MIVNFIKNKFSFISILIFIAIFTGIYSFFAIPRESAPAVDIPMFVVTTVYPGADQNSVENQITNKLESEFKSIPLVKQIHSVSNPNFSTIILTFEDEKNTTDAKIELTESLNKVSFPSGVGASTIKQIDPNDQAIYSFSVAGESFSKNIYEQSKNLEDNLKSISGISDVVVIGKPDKKINIFLDEKKINEFSLNISNIKNLLSGIFINQSVGKKSISGDMYNYQIQTFEDDIEALLNQIKETDLISYAGQSVKLKDVAEVYLEEDNKAEKSFIIEKDKQYNTISFDIKATPGADSEAIIKKVMAEIKDFEAKNPDLKIYETYSLYAEIDEIFGTFVSNFWQSGLIILIIVFVFIGGKISLGIALSFPLVYLITFILLNFSGYSFNMIVSFSLVLTLGIMVDNLVVITEGLSQELKNKNLDFWEALRIVFKKYYSSIIAGTLTTIVIFAPISLLLAGIIGQFIRPLGITIMFTLSTSLFVGFFILPIIIKKALGNKEIETKETTFGKKLHNLSEKVGNFSAIFLKNRKRAKTTVILFWGIFIVCVSLIGFGVIKQDFLSPSDQDNVFVNIKYPSGYSNSQNMLSTNDIYADIKNFLETNYPGIIKYYYVNIGNLYSINSIGAASNITSDNQSYLNIKLIEGEKRKVKSYTIIENLQNFINNNLSKKYYLAEISTIGNISMSGGKEVGFYITGDDLEQISNYIEKIKPEIEKIDGIYNVSSNFEFTNGKIKYLIDPNKVMQNGFSLENFTYLLTSIKNSDYYPSGIPLHTFKEFGKDDITLTLYTNYKGNIDDLKIGENFTSQVTKEKILAPELKNIQHYNTKKQLSIEADKNSHVPLGEITEKIDEIIKNNPLPAGLSFEYNDNIANQDESSIELGKAFGIGVLIMLLILIYQFNSLKLGLIVLTSTMLAIIGVVFFLLVFGLPFSFPAKIGIFGVIGVGINNAILFTDLFTKKEKIDLKKDLSDTMKERFPAIFLTTLTTISGLLTLAFKDELWGSLAIAFIGGLVINVFIIMVYLPSFYYVIHKGK